MKGSLLVHKTAEDFSQGKYEGTVLKHSAYDAIQLVHSDDKYIRKGCYTSEIIDTEPFKEMVLSWNADTPKDTSVMTEGQICVDGKWSKWFSWGIWSASEENSSVEDDSDPIAYIDADTLTVKVEDKAADAFRYRITLNSEEPTATPAVRLIAAAIRMPDREMNYSDSKNVELTGTEKSICIPAYSQMIRDPEIGPVICSATCLSMILNFYGIKITPEEAAWGVWDNVYDGAGNWSFNCAYAGSLGMESYVAFMNSVEDLKKEISQGHPVEVSVAYKNDDAIPKELPVLHGAPTDYTAGHLIIICGFTRENGQDYLIAHDPAAKNNSGVKVKYLEKEFEAAWRKRTAYIIHPGATSFTKPEKLQGNLVSTGIIDKKNGRDCAGFILKCNSDSVYLSSSAVRTIMYTSSAGREWEYVKPDPEAVCLWFDTSKPKGEYKFLIILKNKLVFEVHLDWKGLI